MTAVIDKETGEVVSTTAGKPSFWEWVKYLVNDWQHDDDLDDIIAFAIRMAAWSDNGKEVYRSTHKLASLAGVSLRTAKRRKAKTVELGMFREIGGHSRGIPKLEIALPPHLKGASPDTLKGVKSDTRYKQSNQLPIQTVKGVKSDTLPSATGQWSEATDQESSAGVNPDTLTPSYPDTVTLPDGTVVEIPDDVLQAAEPACSCLGCREGIGQCVWDS